MDEALQPEDTPSGLEGPKLRFFLENQAQIQEWQGLANEAWDEVALSLADLRNELSLDPRPTASGIEIGSRVVGETPTGPVLYRSSWCCGEAGSPDVAVALGWDGRVDPSGMWPRTGLPYVGVNTSHTTEPGKDLENRLRLLVAQKLANEPRLARTGFREGSHWVVYCRLSPSPMWWQSVDAWHEGVIKELLTTWSQWSPVIDAALADLGREER
jgi:hypothetical protein